MLLWLSGCQVAVVLAPISGIDWQGPQHPGDLGDAYSLLIGHTALPNQFAHQSSYPGPSPSLPVTGWHSTRANRGSSGQPDL